MRKLAKIFATSMSALTSVLIVSGCAIDNVRPTVQPIEEAPKTTFDAESAAEVAAVYY